MGSNGSVMPFFLNKKMEGVLPITDDRMTRFNISLEDGVEMVMNALEKLGEEKYLFLKYLHIKLLTLQLQLRQNVSKKLLV